MQPKLTVKEYTAALIENRLLGLKCSDCGSVTAPPRMVCGKCAGVNLRIIELAGKGKIVTFTSIYVAPESRQGKTPYIVVMVELNEGPWIMANLSDAETGAASMELIGKKVRMITPLPTAVSRPEGGIAHLFVLDS